MPSRSFSKVLIANRGEIARRIMRTCHAMGLSTVAVFSDADERAPHVDDADEAVRIGPAPSADSYLSIERLIEAARLTGAQAIHPGYGFLAENADFAEACHEAGLVFIGPPAEVIRAMGSKLEAKRVVSRAGVPVIPGYDGEDQSTEHLAEAARTIGFPVLVKASAGGGGKGMRVVARDADLVAALDSARRLAESAFGDGTLLLESYIDRPRHVEFQILGDSHGRVVHLYERECSIQRRHQKIIEETPSTALDDELRARMGQAAVAVGEAIGYQNAGTVEFILAPDRSFYFLEVNTRLQVEHPVTECVTGLDLVREQIRVARGEAISWEQDTIARGAAIECRLYAEDPDEGFLPSTGQLVDWHLPAVSGVRLDSGVELGSPISVHYDPLLAKVVAHGATRREALDRMTRALRGLSAQGVTTNRAFLLRVLEHPAFEAGDIDTHFIERHVPLEGKRGLDIQTDRWSIVAATLAQFATRRRTAPGPLPGIPPGYRNNPFTDQTTDYRGPHGSIRVAYTSLSETGCRVRLGEWTEVVTVRRWDDPELELEDASGRVRRFRVRRVGSRSTVHGLDGDCVLDELPRFPTRRSDDVPGGYRAPMPGKIIAVSVTDGQTVAAGDPLVILEAMKMEQVISAAESGRVTRVCVTEGEQVEADAVLVVLSTDD